MITRELLHRSLANDFALLFTESEFDLAEHIDTVCLPQVLLIISLIVITMTEIILVTVALSFRWISFWFQMLQPGEEFHYSQCFATGWGKDQFGAEGQYQVKFKVLLCTLCLKTLSQTDIVRWC